MNMKISIWIRRLSYQPLLVKITRRFYINRLLSFIYCKLTWPKNNKIKVSFKGIDAEFLLTHYGDKRYIEGASRRLSG